MRANHDEIRTIGEDLVNKTAAAQQDAPLVAASAAGGPLGQALAAAHAEKAAVATEFLNTVQQGLTQAGNSLVQAAAGMANRDTAGADAITQAVS